MTRRTATAQETPSGLREERGLTIARTHRLADLDRKTLEKFEAGCQGVNNETIEKVAQALTKARPDLTPVTPERLYAAFQNVRREVSAA